MAKLEKEFSILFDWWAGVEQQWTPHNPWSFASGLLFKQCTHTVLLKKLMVIPYSIIFYM